MVSRFDTKFKPVYGPDGKTIQHYVPRDKVKTMPPIRNRCGLTEAWEKGMKDNGW